jgi:catechol 2,3-dioxygenase-like lactoylglutathione lyase family enzyme
MLSDSTAFSGFAVDDLDAARTFYGETLGLELADEGPGFVLALNGGARPTFVYPRPGHVPAEYTILNFDVADVEAEVDALTARGVVFERYEGAQQDEKGISHGLGPDIAWFKDPAGNILSILKT